MKIDPEILSIISHELRFPLTAIRGYVSLLDSGMFGDMSGDAKQAVGKVYADVIREIYLVNDFGMFLKLHNGNPLKDSSKETIPLLEKVRSVADLYGKEEEKAGEAKFNITGDKQLQVETFSWPLEVAISFLLKYVVRGSDDGANVDIEVSEKDGTPMISVKDNDKKIKIDEKDMFNPLVFNIGKRSGIELFIAKEALQLLSGFKVGVLPDYKRGNIFYILKS